MNRYRIIANRPISMMAAESKARIGRVYPRISDSRSIEDYKERRSEILVSDAFLGIVISVGMGLCVIFFAIIVWAWLSVLFSL